MPELPEVEAVRVRLHKSLRGHKIKEVIFEEGDRFLFAFANSADFRRALEGAKITGTGRKGKYFWLELNRKPWPVFHLGMTGNISILAGKKGRHEKIWGGAKLWREGETENRLWFARLRLLMDNGTEMAFTDPRRFGRVWLAEDPAAHPRIAKLGHDALGKFPTAQELQKKLLRRKNSIKAVLLDQKLFAGIGNWLADEILYQARLSPHRKASELSTPQVKELRAKLLSVVKQAVKVGADYDKYPESWLFHHRWGKNKNAKTARGEKIIHEEIGGRTAAWVPGRQK
jgi:formamidopyrimidine-DNA glycosylase